jgi:hypothetical protein
MSGPSGATGSPRPCEVVRSRTTQRPATRPKASAVMPQCTKPAPCRCCTASTTCAGTTALNYGARCGTGAARGARGRRSARGAAGPRAGQRGAAGAARRGAGRGLAQHSDKLALGARVVCVKPSRPHAQKVPQRELRERRDEHVHRRGRRGRRGGGHRERSVEPERHVPHLLGPQRRARGARAVGREAAERGQRAHLPRVLREGTRRVRLVRGEGRGVSD